MDLFAPYTTDGAYISEPSYIDIDDFYKSSKNAKQFKDRNECRKWARQFFEEWHNVCCSLDSILNS